MNRHLTTALLAASLSGVATSASAVDFDVTISNLTGGVFFTPLLVAAHPADQTLFTSGQAASDAIQAMAEGGSIAGLVDALTTASATIAENPASGLLAAGMSTTASLNTDDAAANEYLSIVAMMLPTNDGFVGLRNWKIPTEAGTYRVRLNAYDAGTEANDEVAGSGMPGEAGFPAPAPVAATTGTGGMGQANVSAEGFVHIHRGVLGDTDATGGSSDIDALQHRWLNPVAEVVVTVK